MRLQYPSSCPQTVQNEPGFHVGQRKVRLEHHGDGDLFMTYTQLSRRRSRGRRRGLRLELVVWSDGCGRGRGWLRDTRGCAQSLDDQGCERRQVDRALTSGAELAMVIAQLIKAAKGQVEQRPVQRPLPGSKLVEQAFEIVSQPIDRVEAHDYRRPLDAVKHPEGFRQCLGVGRVLLQPQERIVERGDLLIALIKVEGQQF